MDDKKKDHPDPKILQQRICLQQPETHNVPSDDVENTHCTNKGGDLLLANKPGTVF